MLLNCLQTPCVSSWLYFCAPERGSLTLGNAEPEFRVWKYITQPEEFKSAIAQWSGLLNITHHVISAVSVPHYTLQTGVYKAGPTAIEL